jgi:hypothetical protein
MALHTQRQGLNAHQDHEGVKRRDRRTEVAQTKGPAGQDEGHRTKGIGEDLAVIAGVWRRQIAVLVRSRPVEIAAITESSNENSFLTIGNFMKKKIIERGKDNLIEKEKPKSNDELALDPLTVASAGAGILEKTTGKKVFLSRSFDKSGSVKSYTFAAGDFKFERIK